MSELLDNTSESRFEYDVKGYTGIVEYILQGNTIYLTHAEVPSALEGQGVGSAMVKQVLDTIASHKLKMVPMCPFVRHYLNKHPEYMYLVAE